MRNNTLLKGLAAFAATVLLPIGMVVVSSRCVNAQAVVSARNWKTQIVTLHVANKSLSDIAALLATQTGRNILIDGEPALNSADLHFSGAAASALDKIADMFDYAWTVSKSGIVLMTKRFHNPASLPQTNAGELRQTAQEIVESLKILPSLPDRQLSECFGSLAATFTPAQAETLQNHGRLRTGDLLPSQQELARTAIYTHLLTQPLAKWQRLLEQLTNLPTAYLQIEETDIWLDLQGNHRQKGMAIWFKPGGKSGQAAAVSLVSLPWQPILQVQDKPK